MHAVTVTHNLLESVWEMVNVDFVIGKLSAAAASASASAAQFVAMLKHIIYF
jgi:hypothetical protein